MLLFRASFVVMVSVFLRCEQRVVCAPVHEKSTEGEFINKSGSNLQDEVNFIDKVSTPVEPNEPKTKEAGTEASGDNTFANFNPNNTIAYSSSSNILSNDVPYDMIFIPSSGIPSELEGSDMSSDFSDNDKVFDDTIVGDIGEVPREPEDMDSYYDEYYSYIGDWRDLSWLTEFSDVSHTDDNFLNNLLGADENSLSNQVSINFENDKERNEGNNENVIEFGGYEQDIDEVKTRKKRSLGSFGDDEETEEVEEEDEGILESDESSLSSFYDVSLMTSEVFSSLSEDASELDEEFNNEIDPKRAEMEKVLARYPRPGDEENWNKNKNNMELNDGDQREKRAVDLFKYYAVNFPTLEGMKKRDTDDFLTPFDFDDIANDLVPSSSKIKRSLQPPEPDNDPWNTLDKSYDTSSYDLGPLESTEHSEGLNNDIYLPDVIGNSKEFGHFLPHIVAVPTEYESRKGHRFDIPDYNEGKYFAYRSTNLKPPSQGVYNKNTPNVPDPGDLLKLYKIIKNLNQRDVIETRKPRMYLPGPHAGYQAYGNEIHRAMFGSKRSTLKQAFLNPLPIGLKQVYRPNHRKDAAINTVDEYMESNASSYTEDGIDDVTDVSTTLAELMKEIDELTIIEKLLRLVELTNQENQQLIRR